MLTQFDANSAARIGRVVRTVEGQFPRARPLTFGATFNFGFGLDLGLPPDIGGGGGGRPEFRIATFSGAWTKGSSKTVTHKYGSATASALNLFANVPAPTSSGDCAIARDGTAWFLIAAVC
jgi:hypothetical protein